MIKPTLLTLWVIVLAVVRLQAVPLRDHGGVIYGTDFLRILDPRARSLSAGSEATDQLNLRPETTTTTTSERTTTTTTTTTTSHPEEPPGENLMLNSRHLRKLGTSTLSAISSVSSSSLSSSSTSVGSQRVGISRHKSGTLSDRHFQKPSNELGINAESRIKATTSDSHSITPRLKQAQPSSTPGSKINEKTLNHDSTRKELSLDKNDTELFLDYDYYYYYLDDLPLPEKSNVGSNVNIETADSPSSKRSPSITNNENNSRNVIAPTTPVPLPQITTLKSQKNSRPMSSTTTVKPATSTTRRTFQPQVTKVPSSTSRTPTSTSPRPSITRSPFRYQTTKSTVLSPIIKTEETSTIDIKTDSRRLVAEKTVTVRPSLIKPAGTTTTTEKNRISLSSVLQNSSTTTTPAPKSTTTPAPKSTTESQIAKETVSSEHITNSPIIPSKSNDPKLLSRVQRPNIQRNNNTRNFRYTTPVPKDQSLKREMVDTEDSVVNENTLPKSLGSATSSSVVVEVRVESSRPEARRMPLRKSLPASQTINREVRKEIPVSPRTVHTVNPNYHTTSFLLSDSLVVDVANEPKTSGNQARQRNSDQRRQSPSSNVHVRTTTTTTPKAVLPIGLIERLTLNRNVSRVNNQTSSSSTSNKATLETTLDIKETPRPVIKSVSESRNNSSPTQTLSQSVSTSVSRTVAHAEEVSVSNAAKPISIHSPTIPTTNQASTIPSNLTVAFNHTVSTGNRTFIKQPRANLLHGRAPLGLAPFGQAPGGLAPFGDSPGGLYPHGIKPTGLHPYGLSPQGPPANKSANATKAAATKLTFVDATVAGAADANSSVGYVTVEHNVSRFRLEEKTADGFIIGEYGEVDHKTGDVNGVRYTAEGSADPNLIYDALLKFLNL